MKYMSIDTLVPLIDKPVTLK